MAQFGRPSADTDNTGLYTDQAGGSTNIYLTIDESVASDADYIRTPAGTGTYVYTTALTSVAPPVGSILPIRAKRVLATGTTATNLIGLV